MMSKCKACYLSKTCGTVNAKQGWGNPDAKLVILLDAPGDTLAEKLLIWILMRLDLGEDDVFIDYTLKCALPHGKPKQAELLQAYKTCWNTHERPTAMNNTALVVSGSWGAKFILGKQMKDWHAKKDHDSGAWIMYSFKYLLMNPAECVDAWRVIYKAAEEAGLSPRMVVDVPEFRFPSKKLG